MTESTAMSDELVRELRQEYPRGASEITYRPLLDRAADRIESLSRELAEARKALEKAVDTLADAKRAFGLFCKFDASRAMEIAEMHTRAALHRSRRYE